MLVAIGILIGLIVGGGAVAVAIGGLGKSRLGAAEQQRRLMLEEATREADTLRREAQVSAREEAVRLRAEIDQEVAEHRSRIVKVEERVLAKEEEIDAKLTEMARRDQGLSDRETHLRQLQDEHKNAREQQLAELERISGMTVNEAKLTCSSAPRTSCGTSWRAASGSSKKRPAPRRNDARAISSPTHSSASPRVTQQRRRCRSSSSRPTT